MRHFVRTFILLFTTAFASSAQVTLLNKYTASNHNITTVAYGNKSNLMATAGYDESVIIRNTQGEIIKRIKGYKDLISSMAFSPDDKFLIGGGYKGDVFVWNIETGAITYRLQGHKKKITSVDVSSLGIIASGSEDKKIVLWDLANGSIIQTLDSKGDEITCVNFSADGMKLASGNEDGTVNLWEGKTGALITSMVDTDKKAGAIQKLSISPDGEIILSASSNGKIVAWSTSTALKINEFNIKKGDVMDMKYSPDGRYIAIGVGGKGFQVLNAETGALVFQSEKLDDKVYSLAFSTDGKYLINCDFTDKLYQWDITMLRIPETLAQMRQEKEENEKEKRAAQNQIGNPVAVQEKPKSDVDVDIPQRCSSPNSNRYALVIGNEDYSSHQMGLSSESNVDFAVNDATVFKEYARRVFCVPEGNIIFLTDAQAVEMHRAIEKVSLLVELSQGEAEVIFYFAGHGFPDEVSKEPYIMPVDVSGNDLRFAIKVKDLYEKFSQYPHKRITFFMDACFTGGARNQGLLAARAVKVRPKDEALLGNLVVFSASSEQESSLPYKEQEHGMFTYHLLKKLKETNGNVTYGELSDFIVTEVAKKSILINNKPQNPQVNISPQLDEDWKSW
ncbi:MAG TPA: caspase family protein, partial [Tenuifilaceae bacterium]|nr:caspase family protein [Tenuifilaceae bacterium]